MDEGKRGVLLLLYTSEGISTVVSCTCGVRVLVLLYPAHVGWGY